MQLAELSGKFKPIEVWEGEIDGQTEREACIHTYIHPDVGVQYPPLLSHDY